MGYTLAIKNDGSLIAWGTVAKKWGGEEIAGSPAKRIAIEGPVSQVSTNGGYGVTNLALLSSGVLMGWGEVRDHNLTLGEYESPRGNGFAFEVPTVIVGVGEVAEIKLVTDSEGLPATIYRKADGSVWLLPGEVDHVLKVVRPVRVDGVDGVVSIGLGNSGWIPVLDKEGVVKIIEFKAAALINSARSSFSVRAVPGLPEVSQVACNGSAGSGYHCGALDKSGAVWMWGNTNGYGQLGNGMTNGTVGKPGTHENPEIVFGLNNIKKIAVRAGGSYAVDGSGYVYGWGAAAFVGLSLSETNGESVLRPKKISGISGVEDIVVGTTGSQSENIYVILSDGSVWGWGPLFWQELGVLSFSSVFVPTKVDGVNLKH